MRRVFFLLAASCALLCPPSARAAEAKKILILRSGNIPFYSFAVEGFTQKLSSSKIPFVLDDKTLPGKEEEEIDAFMGEIRSNPPDLIFAVGTLATRAAHEKAGNIPFTFCMVVDPDSMGLESGGAVMELHPLKQLEFIRENFPQMTRIGVIHSSLRNQESLRHFKNIKLPGVSLLLLQADNPEEMSRAILRLSKEADCLLMLSDAGLYSPQTATQIILQTLQNNLPLIAVSPSFVKAGALAGVYPDYKENGSLAGEAALRYFAGESLKTMGILWPVKSLSSVNVIVADRLKFPLSKKSLESASEVVR